MTPSKLHEFDGQLLTVREIKALLPCVSETMIRERLAQGVTTRAGMLATRRPTGKGWRAGEPFQISPKRY